MLNLKCIIYKEIFTLKFFTIRFLMNSKTRSLLFPLYVLDKFLILLINYFSVHKLHNGAIFIFIFKNWLGFDKYQSCHYFYFYYQLETKTVSIYFSVIKFAHSFYPFLAYIELQYFFIVLATINFTPNFIL